MHLDVHPKRQAAKVLEINVNSHHDCAWTVSVGHSTPWGKSIDSEDNKLYEPMMGECFELHKALFNHTQLAFNVQNMVVRPGGVQIQPVNQLPQTFKLSAHEKHGDGKPLCTIEL